MSDYEFPEAPEVEKACRAAHRALEGVVFPGSFVLVPEKDLSVTEVISQFRSMVEQAEMAVAAQLGPLVSWEVPQPEGDWELVMTGADLDNGAYGFGAVTLGRDAFEGPDGGWRGSALGRAARAYKGACGWDFVPDEAGVWLLMLAPVSGMGGEDGVRRPLLAGARGPP